VVGLAARVLHALILEPIGEIAGDLGWPVARHLSLKSQILLENYYLPGDLERAVAVSENRRGRRSPGCVINS
jgi:hypothetical protein